MPANPPMTLPITKDWSFMPNTFLPSARVASSSSRTALSSRPQGLRASDQINRHASATRAQPTTMVNRVFWLNENAPHP